MAENYLTRTTFRAAHNGSAAVSAMTPVHRVMGEYHGAVTPGKSPGEVTVVLYVSADGTLAAAAAAIGVIQRAFEDARKPLPGRPGPAHVEAFKADPPI